MLNLLANVSQWEREIIGERTKEAMRYLKEQKQSYSRPVYGYDIEAGRLYENELEQEVISRAKVWREQGRPYRHIAAVLNAEGVPTKRGGQWAAMTIKKLVSRG
jgi:site-specific DNA recombinase